jgi:hypothetical protein
MIGNMILQRLTERCVFQTWLEAFNETSPPASPDVQPRLYFGIRNFMIGFRFRRFPSKPSQPGR